MAPITRFRRELVRCLNSTHNVAWRTALFCLGAMFVSLLSVQHAQAKGVPADGGQSPWGRPGETDMTTLDVKEFNRWLRELGFRYDPFILTRTENYFPQFTYDLEEHFVSHPGCHLQLQCPLSTAIIAPPGSGKSINRFLLEKNLWEQPHTFVVCYTTSSIPDSPWLPQKDILQRCTPSWAEQDNFNTGAIRKLLLDAFTVEDLRRFWQDSSAFRDLLDSVEEQKGLKGHVDKLITYCSKRLLFRELLAEVEERNPRQYARHQDKLRDETNGRGARFVPSSVAELPFRSIPAAQLTAQDSWKILQRELAFARRLGCDRVYILLDGLGRKESSGLGDVVELLLRESLSDILKKLSGLYFKLFLPLDYKRIVENSPAYWQGDLELREIQWSEQRLEELLENRLVWAKCKDALNRVFSATSSKDPPNLDQEIIQAAMECSSPDHGMPEVLLLAGQALLEDIFAQLSSNRLPSGSLTYSFDRVRFRQRVQDRLRTA